MSTIRGADKPVRPATTPDGSAANRDLFNRDIIIS